MLSVFFGNDQIEVRQKAFAYLEKQLENLNEMKRVGPETYERGLIRELAQGVSLFGACEVILLDSLGEEAATREEVAAQADLMGASENHFILIEQDLGAKEKKALEKYAAHFEEVLGAKKERFNAFLLTEALLRKDKKALWLLLMEAWRNGLTNEEIIGVLMWQLKTLRLVERTNSAEDAGLKPFVYSKAKRALGSFGRGEVDSLARSLLQIYHDGHLGKLDLNLALEKWVLHI